MHITRRRLRILFTAPESKSRIIANSLRSLGIKISKIGKICKYNEKSKLLMKKTRKLHLKTKVIYIVSKVNRCLLYSFCIVRFLKLTTNNIIRFITIALQSKQYFYTQLQLDFYLLFMDILQEKIF